MAVDKTDLPRGRHWRIFAPDYKCSTGSHWLILLALFIIGHASSILSLQYYGEVLARPNLGIMLAGLLLLNKRDAIKFIIACNLAILVSYFFWDAPWPRTLIAPLLNTAESCLAAALIRRYCGARIDFSRPIRLARYFVYAIIPATIFRALAETFTGYGFLYGVSDNLATMLASHIVSMGLLTPLIVLIGQGAHKAQVPIVPSNKWSLFLRCLLQPASWFSCKIAPRCSLSLSCLWRGFHTDLISFMPWSQPLSLFSLQPLQP